jgi:antitoxin component of RelBE/YafQ-DinJ toxin-antitoxin module
MITKVGISIDKNLLTKAKTKAKELEVTFSFVIEELLGQWIGNGKLPKSEPVENQPDSRLDYLEQAIARISAELNSVRAGTTTTHIKEIHGDHVNHKNVHHYRHRAICPHCGEKIEDGPKAGEDAGERPKE